MRRKDEKVDLAGLDEFAGCKSGVTADGMRFQIHVQVLMVAGPIGEGVFYGTGFVSERLFFGLSESALYVQKRDLSGADFLGKRRAPEEGLTAERREVRDGDADLAGWLSTFLRFNKK